MAYRGFKTRIMGQIDKKSALEFLNLNDVELLIIREIQQDGPTKWATNYIQKEIPKLDLKKPTFYVSEIYRLLKLQMSLKVVTDISVKVDALKQCFTT